MALFQFAFWFPLVCCTWLALVPNPPDNPVFHLGDVVLHAAAFTYLTFALVLLLLGTRAPAYARISLTALAWMFGYGLTLELVQSFIPARTAELKDVVVDLVGILTGLLLARLLAHRVRDLLRSLLERLPGVG